MKVLDFDVQVGDGVAVGGLRVFPLTSEKVDGPPYLTGPEAYDAGLIEVTELDPPEVPLVSVTNLATCRSCWSKGRSSAVATRTGR